jgi:two-component sensor histidine kinase
MRLLRANKVRAWVDAALSRLHRRVAPGSWQAYGFAILCVGTATVVEAGLLWLDDDISPLGTFYPAVLFAALIGGVGPGAFTAVTGGIIAWWGIMPPRFSFILHEYADKITLITYAVASIIIIWAADYFRRLSKRLEDEEQFRKLAVEELAHRLKNKTATIQTIIRLQLGDYPRVRDNILGRLMALSATDELILEAQGQGASLHDILRAELGPYAAPRASVQGENALLPPKHALAVALLAHELSTNSAKYGALSSDNGRVTVSSSVSHQVLRIEWCERGGPAVSAPTRRGFGLRLLERALEQFEGNVETRFEPAGLICTMQLRFFDHRPSNAAAKGVLAVQ